MVLEDMGASGCDCVKVLRSWRSPFASTWDNLPADLRDQRSRLSSVHSKIQAMERVHHQHSNRLHLDLHGTTHGTRIAKLSTAVIDRLIASAVGWHLTRDVIANNSWYYPAGHSSFWHIGNSEDAIRITLPRLWLVRMLKLPYVVSSDGSLIVDVTRWSPCEVVAFRQVQDGLQSWSGHLMEDGSMRWLGRCYK